MELIRTQILLTSHFSRNC